jgi:hypothetical protein
MQQASQTEAKSLICFRVVESLIDRKTLTSKIVPLTYALRKS